jgi:hypothetical protein
LAKKSVYDKELVDVDHRLGRIISTIMTRMLSGSNNHCCHRGGCVGGAFGKGSGGGPDFAARDIFASLSASIVTMPP